MSKIIIHLALIALIIALLVLCMIYPFLPGGYDRLALGLSTMAQVFGIVGMLLVPLGFLWLIYELRRPAKSRSHYFGFVTIFVASLVALVVAGAGFATIGLAAGLLTLTLWLFIASRLLPRARALRNATQFNPAPLYLVLIPVAALLFQLALATPLADFSRSNAISASAELISDIEAYRAEHERYPTSLLAVWKDYAPSVVGIEQFHYEAHGDAYNLAFEQPRFLLDNIGAREFVVYNPLDEHAIISHDSWILLLSPTQVQTNQGWFEVNDTAAPNWKSFLFD